ncbi:hypothetical protein [Hymenobacter weizhouensis]|uniref:hypothetical protein n=1 Tax=Hymenobacter sp. YIM 151500-1 TaxID=2987689 RepID=UPI0022279172|nr:hypothetical protein [Hymenobacter sp. YIM 151500-1]UYZ64273.1 hypothetical protein OIS53_05345 [Hymenobacter sp. YIM 151500-1]
MNRITDYKQINGWGVDADPQNDPTYPMKPHHTDAEQRGYTWERPAQQPESVEVLQSIERPNLPAVFGTASPPQGLSGMLRRVAFKYSESHYGHWLPLLLADRVNVVEGIVEDLAHGKLPNIFAEKGYKASWQHDRTGLITRLTTAAVVGVGLVAWLSSSKKKRKPQPRNYLSRF